MNKIFVFLILSSLVIAGQMTTCNRCWNIGSTKCCRENKLQCDGSGCMTWSEYCNVNGVEYETIMKGCSVPLLCDKCLSVTTNSGLLIRVGNACGERKDRNAKLNYNTNICDSQLQPNNYKCPSCFRTDTSGGCESTGFVDCLGLEGQCLDYGASVILPDGKPLNVSIKGCVTSGGCDLGLAAFPGCKETNRNHITCTPAIPKA
ncbi:phospholipase A2 inhibitor subunit gamma B-like [Rana temporaria]|uniref:phospholipase A2 inhibitor subunit gamma B-like n=1 Tax=Rana temporaria TaxID=8407 RepID=UPI001AAC6FF3|nr:phospholipase A2 inhibitor subunit gamma B-like [Rana temporaria]